MKYAKNIVLKNEKPCQIRNASGGDAREVLEVFLLTHEETDYLASYRDEAAFDAAFEEKFLVGKEASEREVYLCAVVDGRIVGTAGVDAVGTSEKMRHRAQLGIAVCKEFWGLGIGKALTTACVECAREAGYVQLELEVVGDNFHAISLYESMGFCEFGRNPKGFLSRCHGWQELISMRLELAKN